MNRREMLKLVGATALVPFAGNNEEEDSCCYLYGIDWAEPEHSSVIYVAEGVVFREHVNIPWKSLFKECTFEKGFILRPGSEGTEFWGCVDVRRPMTTQLRFVGCSDGKWVEWKFIRTGVREYIRIKEQKHFVI